jgi:hypothetical protein
MHVQNFLKFIETQHNHAVKVVRTDNGPEFFMPDFFDSKGIIHQTRCLELNLAPSKVEPNTPNHIFISSKN